MPEWMIRRGHVLDELRGMEDESVQCVVTSPPYWGLRDYGLPAQDWGDWSGSLGLEPTPELYVDHIVEVFREIRRVLRKDGTVWLNLGDSYATSPPGNKPNTTALSSGLPNSIENQEMRRAAQVGTKAYGVKPKDLVGIPWRVAFALQAAGWWLRADIVWAKPNPMPESVRDRPTRAHEYLFLLTKSGRYYYDNEAVREPLSPASWLRLGQESFDSQEGGVKDGLNPNRSQRKALENLRRRVDPRPSGWADTSEARRGVSQGRFPMPVGGTRRSHVELEPNPDRSGDHREAKRPSGWNDGPTSEDKVGRYGSGNKARAHGEEVGAMGNRADLGRGVPWEDDGGGRNSRSVWTIPTEPFPEAHFATYPTALVVPCIKAGSSEKGCCPECGAPWERMVETKYQPVKYPGGVETPVGEPIASHQQEPHAVEIGGPQSYQYGRARRIDTTTGWRSTCFHESDPIPCLVLDPFAGSGTTGVVALQLGRRFLGIELNPVYAEMAERRIHNQAGLFSVFDGEV